MNKTGRELDEIVGLSVVRATSALNSFSCELENGHALLVEASGDAEKSYLRISTPSSRNLPEEKDAVCAVDWSWIYGSRIESINVSDGSVNMKLNPAGPLSIALHLWQGKPFLAFQPYKSPAK